MKNTYNKPTRKAFLAETKRGDPMITAALAVALGICAVKLFIAKIEVKVLAMYILSKGHTPPTKEELRPCARLVLRRTFGLKP